MKLTLLLLVLLTPASAPAQVKAKPSTDLERFFSGFDPGGTWVYLGESDITRFYYDRDTLKRLSNSIVRVWTGEWPTTEGVVNAKWRQEKIDTLEEAGLSAEKYRAYERSKKLEEYDCENDRFRLIHVVDYDDKGNIIDSSELNADWQYAIPQTVGYGMLKKLCNPNYKPPPPRLLTKKALQDYANGTDSEDESTDEAKKLPTTTPTTRAKRTPAESSPDPFIAHYVGGDALPKVTVTNSSRKILTLTIDYAGHDARIGQVSYEFGPSSSRTLSLEGGNYNFKASALGVNPLEGQKDFQRGYVYTWKFHIVTTVVPGSRGVSFPSRRRRRP